MPRRPSRPDGHHARQFPTHSPKLGRAAIANVAVPFGDTRRKVLGRALCDKVADPYAPLGVDVIPAIIVLASARYVASWHTVSPWPTTVAAGPASIGWSATPRSPSP